MKTVTLRNIPPRVAEVIRRKAAEGHTSAHRAVVGLLEEAVGSVEGRKRPVVYHDLDDLCGAWSPAEASDFQAALERQRAVDAEVWK